jgi:plasmid stability protein
MRRTTLTIKGELLRRLKSKAAKQGKSVAVLINELLRQALSIGTRRPPYKLEIEGWEAEAQPGVDIPDRDMLFDLMKDQ